MRFFYIIIFFVFLHGVLLIPLWSQESDRVSEEKKSEQITLDADVKAKSNPEKNYLEMAINYINEKNFIVARKYLQLAQSSEDEKIFQDAVLWELYIESLEGKKNIESSLNSLTQNIAPKAMYYVSDGWQTYFETNPEAKELYALSIEYKEKLIARYPDSDYAILAAKQLVPLFIIDKNYDRALNYLLGYLDPQKKDSIDGIDDKAWFYLGQILENSREYRDLHKAIQAYQMVMRVSTSFFYDQAKNRIAEIERFYRIIQ